MKPFVLTDRLTAKGQRALELYKQDISKVPLLTPDQEFKHALKAQEGDEESIRILVESNLRFVISVAKMYTRDSSTMEDLIQVGNIGLVDSAKKFDPTKGFKFISYAVWHIRKEMIKYLGDNSRIVRLPQNKGQIMSKIREGAGYLHAQLGRDATDEEILEWIQDKTDLAKNMDLDQLRLIVATDLKSSSLDMRIDSGDSASPSLGDRLDSGSIHVYKNNYDDHQKEILEILMEKLNPVERYAVEENFGMNTLGYERNSASIAEDLNLSQENVRVKIKKALRKMKIEAKRIGVDVGDLLSE